MATHLTLTSTQTPTPSGRELACDFGKCEGGRNRGKGGTDIGLMEGGRGWSTFDRGVREGGGKEREK